MTDPKETRNEPKSPNEFQLARRLQHLQQRTEIREKTVADNPKLIAIQEVVFGAIISLQ